MRRVAGLILVLVACATLLVAATGAGGEEDTYEVRAIFDNAGFLVVGEEVRIAGAKVGSVSEVDVTGTEEAARADGSPAPGKAVVVMRIDDPGFQDFREDASCLIRPQSLIGEKFVECEPTQPRAASSEPPPPLEQIGEGEPGEGQYLLPLERNGKAVDLDLVNDIMEEPYPDRFRLILNDLGAGLAARGEELAEIVERSNPALRETNEVLEIISRQSQALARLSSDADRILSALARERDSVTGFINASETTAAATAARSAELEQTFQRFPGFLRELRLTMGELDRFSETATPVFSDFREAAPSLTRATEALGPFSQAGIGAFETLGDASEEAGPDIVAADPVIRQALALTRSARPATRNLARFLSSLRKTDGFEYLTELVFNASGSINAFDEFGHFLRALLPVNNCVDYEIIAEPGCDQSFGLAQGTPVGALMPEAVEARARKDALGEVPERQGSRDRKEFGAGPSAQFGEPGIDASEVDPAGSPQTPAPRAEGETRVPNTSGAAVSRRRMRAAGALFEFLIGEPAGRRARR